jgi:hypothetical protein
MVETVGPQMTSQYGAEGLHAGRARLHARMLMHTTTRPETHTHARMHTETNKQYLLLFHGNNDSRKRVSVALYVHCLLFKYWKIVKQVIAELTPVAQ